jgi:hypothetical protein
VRAGTVSGAFAGGSDPALVAAAVASGPHRMTVGLRPLDPREWIDGGPGADAQIRERAGLLDRRGDVVAALEGSEDAQFELLERLAAHLPQRFPARYRATGDGIEVAATGETVPLGPAPGAPVARAGRLVAEDLCLMREDAEGRFRLVAAALCFPTRWRLADKLGRPMASIHAPVPGYAETVAGAVDRVMRGLDPARPLWRQNWSLLDSPALHQPERVPLARPLTDADLGEGMWLRSERQTLSRLPRSRDVLFTIGIRQCTLAALATVPGAAARLLGQLRAMPPALKAYKGLADTGSLVEGWLERHAGHGPRPGE